MVIEAISPMFVKSARLSESDLADIARIRQRNGSAVRMGRWWWFWTPRLKWNHGLPWRDVCMEFAVQWLCFSVGFVVWSKPCTHCE